MNYVNHYNLLIERAKFRKLDVYVEKHHIVPKCLGGADTKENIVELTPEEHYVAHQLLVKIYNIPSLIYAANMMSVNSNKNFSRNNKLYGWLRRKLQVVAKQRTGTKNGSYGKTWYHDPLTNDAGKYIPGMQPSTWICGRVPKKVNNCIGCGVNTDTPLQKWCTECRPKSEKIVFKNKKIKTEFTEKEKIDALIKNNGNIRRALFSLGLNDSGSHYKTMKRIKASLAQLD